MKRASIYRLPSLAVSLGLSIAVISAPGLFAESNAKSDKKKQTTKASPSPTPSKKAASDKKLVLKDPVATYEGGKVTKAELEDTFNKQIKAMGADPAMLSADQKLMAYHQVLDALIIDRLIEKQTADIAVSQAEIDAELARFKSQFKTDQEFNAYLKKINQSPDTVQKEVKTILQGKKWIDGQMAGQGTVDEKEAKAFYDSNVKSFENPELVRAGHILFLVPEDASEADAKKKEQEAEKALARLKKGEDFTSVAKELSEEPGAKESGGDLDFFDKGQMVPEFGNAAFGMKVGEVSTAPVRTKFGYHVIKVTDKKPAGTMSYAEVKDKLIDYLQNEKKKKVAQQAVMDLRNKANVKNNLPEPKMPEMPEGMSAPTGAPAAPANP